MIDKIEPHQQRVLEEKSELDAKRSKLAEFLYSDKFSQVEPAERERLEKQMRLMTAYSNILGERIAAFSK